jgi:asparagine synthase (glutamine-hydrolysing)
VLAGTYGPGAAGPSISSGDSLPSREDAIAGVRFGDLALAWDPATTGAFVDRRIACVLDGWIDNVEELARDLGRDASEESAQLLALGYSRWADKLLSRLRGRFTLVIWDRVGGRGLMAVDQLGARPLFVKPTGANLVFASEIRDLLRLLPRRPDPDERAVVQWIADGYLERGQALYQGVMRLEGGHWLELSARRWRKARYWAPEYAAPLSLPRQELMHELRGHVRTAVRRRLLGAETIGVSLSGGLDSSTVMAVAADIARAEGRQLRSYSAVFPGHPFSDESTLIDSLNAELGVSHRRLTVRGGGILAPALDFMQTWELPSLTPTLFFGFPLMRLTRADGVRVLLDGEGGDELFGHEPYLLADRLLGGRLASLADLASRIPGIDEHPGVRPRIRILREYALKGALPHFGHRGLRRARPKRYGPPWLTERSARLYAEIRDPWAWKVGSGPLWWRHMADLLTAWRERLGSHDLCRQTAAWAGLTSGHPFLDDLDLIEFMLRVPPELAFDASLNRAFLRESMEGLVPDEVRLRRAKSDFTDLVVECLGGDDWLLVRELLSAPDAEINAFVLPEVVRRRLLDRPSNRRGGGWSWPVWRLVSTECWLRFQAAPEFVTDLIDRSGASGTEPEAAPISFPAARTS